mmetsp:Transcript_10114/g.24242  ORF Transcript_10114/g.24242 Transcript_10114/m.24242 type:complete len:81 (-) Transcript_10114:19-261(-)
MDGWGGPGGGAIDSRRYDMSVDDDEEGCELPLDDGVDGALYDGLLVERELAGEDDGGLYGMPPPPPPVPERTLPRVGGGL